MYDNDSKGISFTAGIFILLSLTIAGIVLTGVIITPVWTSMTGQSIKEMDEGMSNPAYGNVLRIIQTITVVVGFFLPAALTAYMLNRKPFRLLGYSPNIKISQVGLVIVIMIISVFVSASLGYLNTHIPLPNDWKVLFDKWENRYNGQVSAIIGLNNAGEYILAIVIMAFLPALCEETLFRGGLQNFLTRSTKMPLLSIIIVSIVFSAVHLSWYGFLPRFFLGFILGFLYHYSGTIWLNIIAHFFNNALAITALYVYKLQGKPVDTSMTENANSYWGLLALPVVIGLLLFFKRMSHGSSVLKQRT